MKTLQARGASLPRKVAGRLLVVVWIAAAIITWNAVFDASVRRGEREYVDRQDLYSRGRGPRVGIDEVMRPAIARGLRDATAWSLVVVLVPGAGWWVARRRAASREG